MKIGAFAKKFDLNSSTVRFYVNHGLLVPESKGGQREFSKECLADMENILKYKRFRFLSKALLPFLRRKSRSGGRS